MNEPPPSDSDLTNMLRSWREGSGTAFAGVIDQVYAELKVIAAKRLHQSGAVTLSPTEVLHEALIHIMPTKVDFQNRAHFFATMSLAIRSILVDHARARAASKRGGNQLRVTFTGVDVGEDSQAMDLLAIEQALTQLEKLDPRCGQVMHLTYFAGLSQEDIAGLLNISLPTVARDLKFARSWVSKALAGGA